MEREWKELGVFVNAWKMRNFLFSFWREMGFRNSISFGEPKPYVIQLHCGVCVLRAQVKTATMEKKKKKRSKGKKRKREDTEANTSGA